MDAPPQKALGQRVLQFLLYAWLLCFAVTIAAGFLINEDVMFKLLALLLVLSAALVASPGVVFLIYTARHPATGIPREMRRSAVGSGLTCLFAALMLWLFPRPALLFMIPGALLAALGAVVLVRTLRLARPDPALLTAPPLRHRGVSITGAVAIFLFVILAAKL
ncbi:MAG: hypothetical protein ABR537_00785 [Gemmatimonadales bacterium]